MITNIVDVIAFFHGFPVETTVPGHVQILAYVVLGQSLADVARGDDHPDSRL